MQYCSRTQEFTQNSWKNLQKPGLLFVSRCFGDRTPPFQFASRPLRIHDTTVKKYQYPGNAWDPIYNNFDHRDRFLQITPNWVCIEYASVCAFAYVHWMHNRLWSWRCWKAGDKCRNRFIQVTNTSCWRDTLALCIREKTQTSLKIHSYNMAYTFLLS